LRSYVIPTGRQFAVVTMFRLQPAETCRKTSTTRRHTYSKVLDNRKHPIWRDLGTGWPVSPQDHLRTTRVAQLKRDFGGFHTHRGSDSAPHPGRGSEASRLIAERNGRGDDKNLRQETKSFVKGRCLFLASVAGQVVK
jgi:hypothetical protein